MRNTSQQYFYHPDHLGSSSFISDANGEACQFLAYLPYGEQWVDQRSSGSYDIPYKFSGKELDAETGFNYFGARYYDSGLSIWLSVDPMADKYIGQTPYNYCFNSPMSIIDPLGLEGIKPPGAREDIGPAGEGYQTTPDGQFLYGEGLQTKVWDPNFRGVGGTYDKDVGEEIGQFVNYYGPFNPPNQYTSANADQSGSDPVLVAIAIMMRKMPLIGLQPNPLFGAEAIMIDIGGSFSGAEGDVGLAFILAGPEIGAIGAYKEGAGGLGYEVSASVEFTRIDYYGDLNNFGLSTLWGARQKLQVSYGEGIVIGGAISKSRDQHEEIVLGKTVNINFGAALFPLSAGYNTGNIMPF